MAKKMKGQIYDGGNRWKDELKAEKINKRGTDQCLNAHILEQFTKGWT